MADRAAGPDNIAVFMQYLPPLGAVEPQIVNSLPEPGTILAERDVDTDLLTTFTVQPIDAEQSIESIWQPEPSLSGVLDRFTTPFFMRRIYRQELDMLDEYAQQQRNEEGQDE